MNSQPDCLDRVLVYPAKGCYERSSFDQNVQEESEFRQRADEFFLVSSSLIICPFTFAGINSATILSIYQMELHFQSSMENIQSRRRNQINCCRWSDPYSWRCRNHHQQHPLRNPFIYHCPNFTRFQYEYSAQQWSCSSFYLWQRNGLDWKQQLTSNLLHQCQHPSHRLWFNPLGSRARYSAQDTRYCMQNA